MNKKLKILVTGGAGCIGTNLCNELLSRGHDVISADRLNNERENYIRCDVTSIRQLQNVFEKHGPFDFVFHLAAEYGRWNGEDYYENLWQTNVIGTKHLLGLQAKYGFKHIFFSSAEVYGDYEGVMSEKVMVDNKISDTYQMNDYAITKWAGELMCMNAEKMHGNETVIVRPVNCYGPHEEYTPYRGFIPKFIFHALKKREYTVYRGHKRIIDYVEDTARTIANITDNFIPGRAYNVGSKPEWEMDIKSYSDIVLKAVGIDDSIVNYEDEEEHTTKIKTMDFSLAISELDHDPKVTPEQGINRTVEWMKEKYSL